MLVAGLSIQMPELPEVENFRSLLVPLISRSFRLNVELVNDKPPRRFLSADDIHLINSSECHVADVVRKGKLICMIMEPTNTSITTKLYLFLHMGMTGRISTPNYVPKLESLKDGAEGGNGTLVPPYTFLKFTAGEAQAFFSDPRKFGAVTLNRSSLDDGGFGELAPDALEFARSLTQRGCPAKESNETTDAEPNALQGLVGQTTGIKTILLDQKRVMSGVGNWVADEVLYQCHIHPDQTHLTDSQGQQLVQTLQTILETAIACLKERRDFPEAWVFHCRWGKRNEGKVKDPQGRMVTFIKSAGRTSAIVSSIQKKTAGAKGTGRAKTKDASTCDTAVDNRKKAATKKRKQPTEHQEMDDEDDEDDKPPPSKLSRLKNVASNKKRKVETVKVPENETELIQNKDMIMKASKQKANAESTKNVNGTKQRRSSRRTKPETG